MLNLSRIGATKSWNGQYTVDCNKVPTLPDFTFWFNGKAYPLKGSDYVLEVQGTCISSFTGLDIPGTPLWIVGMYISNSTSIPMIYRLFRRCLPSPLLHGLRSW